jgi:hypothetical protein
MNRQTERQKDGQALDRERQTVRQRNRYAER